MQTDYKCGHAGDIPANMGRGQARLKRIAAHFAGNCPACRLARVTEFAKSLCVLLPGVNADGKRNSRPYTQEEIAAYVAKHS